MLYQTIKRTLSCFAVLALMLLPLPASAQDIEANPSTYDFFTVYLGDSATMTGSVRNVNGGTVYITDFEWTYNPLNMFAVTSPISVPYPLPSGASVDYQVTFTPTEISFWHAILRFHTDSATTPTVDVQFWGDGGYPPPDPCLGLTDCGGVCVDTATSIEHCGDCDIACAPPPAFGVATCEAGICGIDCDDGYDLVDGNCVPEADPCFPQTTCSDGCVDLNTDIDNCGACGIACAPPPAFGVATCDAGICGIDCDPGYVLDAGTCVPEPADPVTLMSNLLAFYDAAIADGKLSGVGARPEAVDRSERNFRHMLTIILARLEGGQTTAACAQLDVASFRADGMRSPRDFVDGPALDELYDRILHVMVAAGCA